MSAVPIELVESVETMESIESIELVEKKSLNSDNLDLFNINSFNNLDNIIKRATTSTSVSTSCGSLCIVIIIILLLVLLLVVIIFCFLFLRRRRRPNFSKREIVSEEETGILQATDSPTNNNNHTTPFLFSNYTRWGRIVERISSLSSSDHPITSSSFWFGGNRQQQQKQQQQRQDDGGGGENFAAAEQFTRQNPPQEEIPPPVHITHIQSLGGAKAWKWEPEESLHVQQIISITNEGKNLTFNKKTDAMVQTNYPFFIPKLEGDVIYEAPFEQPKTMFDRQGQLLHYFEITVLSNPEPNNTTIAIGLATKPYPSFRYYALVPFFFFIS